MAFSGIWISIKITPTPRAFGDIMVWPLLTGGSLILTLCHTKLCSVNDYLSALSRALTRMYTNMYISTHTHTHKRICRHIYTQVLFSTHILSCRRKIRGEGGIALQDGWRIALIVCLNTHISTRVHPTKALKEAFSKRWANIAISRGPTYSTGGKSFVCTCLSVNQEHSPIPTCSLYKSEHALFETKLKLP